MRLLDLAYSPEIPPALLAEMERAAKRLGLPLDTLERLGQSPRSCEAFVRAARVQDRPRMLAVARLVSDAAPATPPQAPVPSSRRSSSRAGG